VILPPLVFPDRTLKDDLLWRDLYEKTLAISRRDIAFLTCLGHLGRRDTDMIISIYVATPKVAARQVQKCCCCVSLLLALSCLFRQCKHRLMEQRILDANAGEQLS
jgi:hypothetical protein